jgi:hypothetical protein
MLTRGGDPILTRLQPRSLTPHSSGRNLGTSPAFSETSDDVCGRVSIQRYSVGIRAWLPAFQLDLDVPEVLGVSVQLIYTRHVCQRLEPWLDSNSQLLSCHTILEVAKDLRVLGVSHCCNTQGLSIIESVRY